MNQDTLFESHQHFHLKNGKKVKSERRIVFLSPPLFRTQLYPLTSTAPHKLSLSRTTPSRTTNFHYPPRQGRPVHVNHEAVCLIEKTGGGEVEKILSLTKIGGGGSG